MRAGSPRTSWSDCGVCPRSAAQLEQNVAALDRLDFSSSELARIDELVRVEDGVDVDLWRGARSGEV